MNFKLLTIKLKPYTMIRKFISFLLILALSQITLAREGMWIPMLLEKYNIKEMQSMGFKLTAEDIYSINQASMKDAVMIFGGGCTGELISEKGLLLTNHHCGYSAIQSHSSVQNDYLTNGFWAMSAAEELPNPNLRVTFLKWMEDVTDKVLEGVDQNMTVKERQSIIAGNISEIRKKAVEGTHYSAIIEPFFHGNQYFLFVNEVFTDVRLVGAPPSAIGKFGGDTDNWMWPRHTGDFAVFRIYANSDNKPASYSPDNVPYKPKAFFPISLNGVQEGDFTMVFGYPGSTAQYVTSHHIDMLANMVYPKLVNLRTSKLEVMNRYMESDAAIRIQYAAKNASLSNSWKRWIGEIKGLEKLDVIGKKQQYESAFNQWANGTAELKEQYGSILNQYGEVYADYATYRLVRDYIMEFIGRVGLESVRLAGSFERLLVMSQRENPDIEAISKEKARLQQEIETHFKNYNLQVDKEISFISLEHLKNDLPAKFLPDIFKTIETNYKGRVSDYVSDYFQKSLFINETATVNFFNNIDSKTANRFNSDPAYILFNSLRNAYYDFINPKFVDLQYQIDSLNHIFMAAMMEFEPDRVFYPDANSTLRVSYGNVKGYEARDGIYYRHFTTIEGIMQKDNPDIYDYRVPNKLKELYNNKDYGRYAVGGTVPVCFIADNHTTGGNSGSPVLNSRGELIGINFDRAWEGVTSDLMFNTEQSRNISLDIRYVLFIIDKFAGAGYLLDEMKLIN